MSPDPADLDYELIARHAVAALDVDWSHIRGLWMTGSFTDPETPIHEESDIDVVLVHESLGAMVEDDEDGPIYDGADPVEIPVKTVGGATYGKRTMDLFSGYTDPPPYGHGAEFVRLDTLVETK